MKIWARSDYKSLLIKHNAFHASEVTFSKQDSKHEDKTDSNSSFSCWWKYETLEIVEIFGGVSLVLTHTLRGWFFWSFYSPKTIKANCHYIIYTNTGEHVQQCTTTLDIPLLFLGPCCGWTPTPTLSVTRAYTCVTIVNWLNEWIKLVCAWACPTNGHTTSNCTQLCLSVHVHIVYGNTYIDRCMAMHFIAQ